MTSRMQITLDPTTRAKIRRRAESVGVTVAEYVRRVIAADLGGEPSRSNVAELFDLDRSAESTDIAKDKRAMIAGAIEAGKLRK